MSETVLWRRLLAEFLGSAFLAAIVIGSGIAAQQLSPGNVGLAAVRERRGHCGWALCHHLDVRPGVRGPLQPGRLVRRRRIRGLRWRDACAYLPAQVVGASAGRSWPT